jgi:pimeloyl-ACP methyl ester carboxylesterase
VATDVWQNRFEVIGLELDGVLSVPDRPRGVVLFVHALDGRRHHTNDVSIATALNERRIATVDVNLLTVEEQEVDGGSGIAFDATTLGARVVALADELAVHPRTGGLAAALYGGGTAAAGVFIAAAARPNWVRAVFSRAGRPDLAGEFVRLVRCPTLLVVGETDGAVRELNERAEPQFPRTARLAQVPGASVLREDPEAMALVAELARDWFVLRLGGSNQSSVRH